MQAYRTSINTRRRSDARPVNKIHAQSLITGILPPEQLEVHVASLYHRITCRITCPYHRIPVSPYPCITVSPASLLLDPAPNCSSQRGVPKRRLHYELLAGPITQHALECARSARSQRGCGSRRPSELNLQDTAPHRTNHTRTCTVLGRTHQLFGSSTGIDSSTGFKPSLDETSLCTRALQTRRQAPPRDVTAPAQSMTMM